MREKRGSRAKKATPGNDKEEEPKEDMTPKGIDMATQTDPEITGVDADDFEEESEDAESEAESSEEEEEEEESFPQTDKGTSSRPIRKKIELKYYFGEDMPDADLKKLAEADVIVPPGLEVKMSLANPDKPGVYSKCVIPKHEFFGPYVGKRINCDEAQKYNISPYIWEVRDDYGKLLHLIDGRNALHSNWLRYVNCSTGVAEQNIRAVQYDGNVYFMATKQIEIGGELLTFYGKKFAKKLGIKLSQEPKYNKDESFACKNCNKMYTDPSHLIGHLKYKCNTGKQRSIFVMQPTGPRAQIPKIKVSEEYAREQNEKLKKFKCAECGKAFIRNYTLQCHLLIHKGVKEHKCTECGREFTLQKHLQRHMLIHTGEKPYKCHLCGRAFSQQGSLQAHSRTHTGIKPYSCKICGRAFALQSPLLAHMKTHSDEKAYKCNTCEKCFTHKNTLARHELIHSGKRPYECEKCGKTFTQTNDLKRHSRTHTGVRPYKCHICGKAFTVEFTLVCHIRTHTGARPYICEHCPKSFTQPGARLKHVRKCHPDLALPTKGQNGAFATATTSTNPAAGNSHVVNDAGSNATETSTITTNIDQPASDAMQVSSSTPTDGGNVNEDSDAMQVMPSTAASYAAEATDGGNVNEASDAMQIMPSSAALHAAEATDGGNVNEASDAMQVMPSSAASHAAEATDGGNVNEASDAMDVMPSTAAAYAAEATDGMNVNEASDAMEVLSSPPTMTAADVTDGGNVNEAREVLSSTPAVSVVDVIDGENVNEASVSDQPANNQEVVSET